MKTYKENLIEAYESEDVGMFDIERVYRDSHFNYRPTDQNAKHKDAYALIDNMNELECLRVLINCGMDGINNNKNHKVMATEKQLEALKKARKAKQKNQKVKTSAKDKKQTRKAVSKAAKEARKATTKAVRKMHKTLHKKGLMGKDLEGVRSAKSLLKQMDNDRLWNLYYENISLKSAMAYLYDCLVSKHCSARNYIISELEQAYSFEELQEMI